MRRYSSISDAWFQSHEFPALLAPFLDKTFILCFPVGFRGIVYNRD